MRSGRFAGPVLAAAAGLCLLSVAAEAADDANSAAPAAWRDLFAQPDPPAAARQIDALLAACQADPNALRKLIAADAAYEATQPGWLQRSVEVRDGGRKHDVKYVLRVPATYRPDVPHALILAAHGQHHDGRSIARMTASALGPDVDRYILLAPTMPGDGLYSAKPFQEQVFLEPLAWAKRHLNVDDDRVYVLGYSVGGHATWHMATMFPRHFAAAVAMAGVPMFEGAPYTSDLYLENLSNLPLWAIWGELDHPAPPARGQVQFCRAATSRLQELGNTLYKPTELPGVGHGGCWPRPSELRAFLADHKRKAAPACFAHFFHLAHHKRGYWAEALDLAHTPMRLDRPVRLKFTSMPSEEEADRRMTEYFRKQLFRLWAEADARENVLTVRVEGIRGVRLYVLDGLVDLSRPVTVRFGRASWRGKVPVSARCMLAHYAADRDASALVCNELDLLPNGKVVVRFVGKRSPG